MDNIKFFKPILTKLNQKGTSAEVSKLAELAWLIANCMKNK